jgi:hypothetical protein
VNITDEPVEDEDGCVVVTELVDGVEVRVHHQIPDDGAPHAPTSECGCAPQVFHTDDGTRVYLHVDQDDDDELDWDQDELEIP